MNITFYSMEKLRRQLEENQEEFIAFCEEESREKPRKLARQLAKHKGYPTKLHYELIEQYGIQPFYRRSFLKKQGYWPENGK